MRRFRFLRKATFALFLGLSTLVSLTLIASQIEQHIFRRRAERLLAEIQALELRSTPWPEALDRFRHWAGEEKFGDVCDQHQCSFEITLLEPVYGFVSKSYFFGHLDDYLRWRLKLTYQMGPFARAEQAAVQAYMAAGGRPAKLAASVGMRDGIVWSKGFEVIIETYWHNVPGFYGGGWGEYTLIAAAHSVPRFYRYGSENPQLRLHPNYEIGRPGGCEICELGWAHFTPYAASADIQRLMQLDLSCLTRIRPCLGQSDIIPSAWAQYLAEIRPADEMFDQPACTASIIETLGRDAPNVVTGAVIVPGGPRKRAHIRLLAKLKGATNWRIGSTYEMGLPEPKPSATTLNHHFVFFFDPPNLVSNGQIDRAGGCSPLPLNESNLANVRRGIDEDYAATDTGQQSP